MKKGSKITSLYNFINNYLDVAFVFAFADLEFFDFFFVVDLILGFPLAWATTYSSNSPLSNIPCNDWSIWICVYSL